MKNKTIILGLDSVSFDLLEPWCEEGLCPNLKKLMDDGVRGNLRTIPNLNSVPAWISFMTGKNPGKHGVYWFHERVEGSYETRFCNGGDVKHRHFWEYLGDSNYEVGAVNVPMSYPARKINGFMISGLDAPGEDAENFTYPSGLYEELKKNIGDYHIDTNILGYARGGRLDKAIEVTYEVIEKRLAAVKYLLKNKKWHCFTVVFTALDRIQHTFWKYLEGQCTEEEKRKYGNVIRDFYIKIDEAVGEILKIIPEETTVIVLSDHGAGFNQMGSTFLKPLLESLALFSPETEKKSPLTPIRKSVKTVLKAGYSFADKVLSKRTRKKLMDLIPGGRALIVGGLHRSDADWEKTKAYSSYIRPEIWINLEGREPQGIVKQSEYEELRDFIIEKLHQCKDIETGNKLVCKVYKREEIYHGEHLEKAPDLLIEWNYESPVSGISYPGEDGKKVIITSPQEVFERRNISGDHRPEGIFIARGKNIKSGEKVENAHIVDIAPTVLHLMNCSVPDDMDGKVLEDIFVRDFMTMHPLKKASSQKVDKSNIMDFSDEEAKKLEERLKNLGYME